MTNKRLNVGISIQAHKIVDKIKVNMDFINKDDAVDYIILEFGKEKNI